MSQLTKLWVNLNSAILKCSVIILKAVISELLVVLNLAVVDCIEFLKLSSMCGYVEYLKREIAAPESIRALYHFPAWTVIVGQSFIYSFIYSLFMNKYNAVTNADLTE